MLRDTQQPSVTIGPALALLEAVRSGDRRLVYRLEHTFGYSTLTKSSSELLRRMLVNADTIDDIDGLEEMHAVVHGLWAYKEFSVRLIDLVSPWSVPVRYARSYACSLISWHLARCYLEEEDFDDLGPLRFEFNSRSGSAQRKWVLGVGYALTLIAEELAFFEEADLEDRINAYRAAAARESLQ